MSASLVGSEMCIRDSCVAFRADAESADETGRQARWRRFSGGSRGRSHPPVSYTHLTLPTICSV
eukprot:10554132-Alexandrium_andersonii.AAC.1